MPRRLPEKTRHMERRDRRFKERKYCPELFQSAPVKEGQEIDVVPQTKIGERLRVKIVKVKGKFAIAEKTG